MVPCNFLTTCICFRTLVYVPSPTMVLLINFTLVALFAVGPNSMPCQLMVGFFAYAKSLEINVDKEELEGTFKI